MCSWNYFVTIPDAATSASVNFDALREQGSIILEPDYYDVKHVWQRGEWTLELGDKILAVAIKPNPFTRVFEVSSYEGHNLVFMAESPFTRTFLIEQNGKMLGMIEPVHAFTKRASIDCSSSVPIPVQIFLFWLTVLMWKRAANSSG
jgi:hypothetical protein